MKLLGLFSVLLSLLIYKNTNASTISFTSKILDLTCVINTHSKLLWYLAQDIKCVVIESHD
jgi:hypothetical protein